MGCQDVFTLFPIVSFDSLILLEICIFLGKRQMEE